MESGGHRSGGGGATVPGAGAEGAAGGLLCHACGYQYPNAHPSAKQRRAHRKHCGKPASSSPTAAAAAAAAVEVEEEGGAGAAHEGRALFPGEGGEQPGVVVVVGGGDGTGAAAAAAECGGGSPGSAREAATAAPEDADKTERSSNDDAGARVILDKCVEDHGDVASEVTLPETNRTDDSGIVNEVAADYSYGDGKASIPEEEVPSAVPASVVSSVQLQDASVPVLQPESGYREAVSPELSVSEMQNLNAVPAASDATGGEIPEHTNDVITERNGTTITGEDGAANTIATDTLSEEKSVKCSDLDSSREDNLQTKVEEVHSNTEVEKDPSDKNLSVVQLENSPNDKPELSQLSGPMLISPIKLVPNIQEPVKSATQVPSVEEPGKSATRVPNIEEPVKSATQVPSIEEPGKSATQVPVGADDFHLKSTDTVKPREQPDSTSVEEDHPAVPDQTDFFEGEHYPIKDGGTETISSAVAPVANAEVISVDDADSMTKNVYSSDVAMGDSIQENVTSNTVVPSQADLVDLTKNATAHEINIVGSTTDVEEEVQNEKSVADLATHEISEVHITESVEEKQQDKESVADSISHLTSAVSSTVNYGENKKETITAVSSCNIRSTSSIEEEKHIQGVITTPSPEKTDVTSNREDVEQDKKTNREISGVCTTEAVEEKDTTSEINSENIISNVEDKKQSEEISADDISDGTSIICGTVNEGKMYTEDTTENPSTHEKTVVHCPDDVEEKNEDTVVDPTSHSIDEKSADLTSHEINAALATEEKKDGEPTLEPISSKISTVGDVEEKKQSEETTSYQISGDNSTQQSTYAAENGMQSKDTTTVPVSEQSEVAEKTDAVEGTEQDKETTAKEISTVQSTEDLKGAGQNEEIADKEVIVDSDRSHVSLKVLLADKNVETKEKKPSTKDRVLSFRRRSSKDNESPVKPGSPKADSGQQDWNSPARLPAEKKPKGKKQQWVPFICCPSIH